MAILRGSTILWGRLESNLVLMLEYNELSSVECLRQSKYVLKVIDDAKKIIKQIELEDEEKETLEELIRELDSAYRAATTATTVKVGGRTQFVCDLRDTAGFYKDGFEAELIVLRSCIKDRFLPDIRKMLSARPFVIMEPADIKPKQKTSPQKKDGLGETLPLRWDQWCLVFHVSENTLRKWDGKDYHFRRIGGLKGRRWVLPISELSAEYLSEYRNIIFKTKPKAQ